jgi:hypothetical protein
MYLLPLLDPLPRRRDLHVRLRGAAAIGRRRRREEETAKEDAPAAACPGEEAEEEHELLTTAVVALYVLAKSACGAALRSAGPEDLPFTAKTALGKAFLTQEATR